MSSAPGIHSFREMSSSHHGLMQKVDPHIVQWKSSLDVVVWSMHVTVMVSYVRPSQSNLGFPSSRSPRWRRDQHVQV
jgi:hypothetical protein